MFSRLLAICRCQNLGTASPFSCAGPESPHKIRCKLCVESVASTAPLRAFPKKPSLSLAPIRGETIGQTECRADSRSRFPHQLPQLGDIRRNPPLAAGSFKRGSRDCFMWPRLEGRAYAGCTQGAVPHAKKAGSMALLPARLVMKLRHESRASKPDHRPLVDRFRQSVQSLVSVALKPQTAKPSSSLLAAELPEC